MRRKIVRLMVLFTLALALAAPLLGQGPSNPKRNNGIKYHNGQIMLGTVNVYFIFYGNWAGRNTEQSLTDFILNLGGSPYHNIITTYRDWTDHYAINSLMWGRNMEDPYSHGTNLSEGDVEDIVADSINSGQQPLDPNGVYFVIASPDVNATGLCTDHCEFHDYATVSGVNIKYAFVGDPQRCPSKCAPQLSGPSGDYATDAIINWVAHSLTGMITNPLGDAWFDNKGRESADKCVNNFGPTYQAPNGAQANVKLGGRDYLLQRNWVNADGGYCSMSYP